MKRTPIIPSEPLLPSAGPTTFTPIALAVAPACLTKSAHTA
jgi:hypothetical protein